MTRQRRRSLARGSVPCESDEHVFRPEAYDLPEQFWCCYDSRGG